MNRGHLVASTRDGNFFDFLEQEGQWATVAGTDTYSYSSIATAMGVSGASIGEIETLTIDEEGYGATLKSMDWTALERLSYATQDDDADGIPLYWSKWGQGSTAKIRLYPKPGQVFEMGAIVRLRPQEMSADGDTPLIPLEFRHAVIVNYAAAVLLRQEGGGEAVNEAVFYHREYESAWQSMRTAHAAARKPTFMLRSPGWDAGHDVDGRNDPYWWAN